MLKGSCLCGAVTYEFDGEIDHIVCCHCSICRKYSGTAFATGSRIERSKFRLLTGTESLKEYQSSPGVHRVSCANCTSPLFTRRDATPDTLILRLGSLDTKLSAKPAAHIFVGDKAEWFDICDGMPQYETAP
ncbi:GFA family protein [bacterium]|nr:MAG: GFA family protein [bacterium]